MVALSVIVPVFNEQSTVEEVIHRLQGDVAADWELIVVDDGSTDGTRAILHAMAQRQDATQFIFRNTNGGKTAAVRTGLEVATGQWVLVQDADLEYAPSDIKRLMAHATRDSPVVYGRRPSCWNMPSRWLFAGGVLLIDILILCVYRRWVRDHATCYKLIPRKCLHAFQLQSVGFEGCVEITAKLMRCGVPIRQIPIQYAPRSIADGKKLTASHGWVAAKAVLRWRKWRSAPDSTAPRARAPDSSLVHADVAAADRRLSDPA